MKRAWAVVRDIWPSLAAFVLVLVGAPLSLGLLGLVLHALVSPALGFVYPPLDQWDQSQVWPLIVAAPIPWSVSFVLAGLVNRSLSRRGWRRGVRIAVYVAIVWLAGLASWLALLAGSPQAVL